LLHPAITLLLLLGCCNRPDFTSFSYRPPCTTPTVGLGRLAAASSLAPPLMLHSIQCLNTKSNPDCNTNSLFLYDIESLAIFILSQHAAVHTHLAVQKTTVNSAPIAFTHIIINIDCLFKNVSKVDNVSFTLNNYKHIHWFNVCHVHLRLPTTSRFLQGGTQRSGCMLNTDVCLVSHLWFFFFGD